MATVKGVYKLLKKKQSKNKKGILKTMYDTIMENGGPVGPISQSLVDLWEKPIEPSPEDKKIIISYIKKGDSDGKNN
jgi:hypothetical protein